jgi:hypothetical protein
MRTQVCRVEQLGSGALSIKSPWTKSLLRGFNRELCGLEAEKADGAAADEVVRRVSQKDEGAGTAVSIGSESAKYRKRDGLGH